MDKINIGVMDFEEDYVSALSSYLQKYGKGKWNVFGFTGVESLKIHLTEYTMDLLIGTRHAELAELCKEHEIVGLLLDDTFVSAERIKDNVYVTKRFQRTMEIGRMIEKIIEQRRLNDICDVMCVAIYSPVGRCGKTGLALDIVKDNYHGQWMYIGLEDYGSFEQGDNDAKLDEVIYFWKERKADLFMELLEELEGVVGTGTSLFDRKELNEADLRWLKEEVLKKAYRGAIFDLGSGVVTSLNIFDVFERIIVPYVNGEYAMQKMQSFECMLKQHGMEGVLRRCSFVCMDNPKEIECAKEMIFKGVGG